MSQKTKVNTNTTFFTNEPGKSLHDRFKATLKHVEYFDVIVGYFRSSGFHLLYDSLKDVEKIRIIVGLNLDKKSFEVIDSSKDGHLNFESHNQIKKNFSQNVCSEMEMTDKVENGKILTVDNYETEQGIKNFLRLLTEDCKDKNKDIENGGNGKRLEFRAHPPKIFMRKYIFQGMKKVRLLKVVL